MPGISLPNKERKSPRSLPITSPTSLAWTTVRTSTLPNAEVFKPTRISDCVALLTIWAICTGPMLSAAGDSLTFAIKGADSADVGRLLEACLGNDPEGAAWLGASCLPASTEGATIGDCCDPDCATTGCTAPGMELLWTGCAAASCAGAAA